MKNLVIVESPTKAKTISKFLGSDYVIKFSMGHVMDLPKSKMGIDIDHDFKPQYEIVADKKPLIAELEKLAKDADQILLATDPDREGEAIASHIAQLLAESRDLPAGKAGQRAKGKKQDKSKPLALSSLPIKRIVFHEITEEAIKEAVQNPRDVDAHLVDAQTARRVLDRLVGYELSPMLWKKVRRGLSAGRVQSVALRLIVEREREIEKFGKEPYFTIEATFSRPHPDPLIKGEGTRGVEFELVEIDGEKIEISQKLDLYDGDYTFGKTTIDTKEKAEQILADCKQQNFVVSDVITKQSKRSPYPPFTTSTLQQQAAVRLGLPGKRTMSLAQKLYEEGFITYHRTDSVTISQSAIKQIRSYVSKTFGEKYLPEKERIYSTKQKNAQEAHEGIRPTQVARSKEVVKEELGEAYAKLYELIWQRTVASQMSDAQIESTSVLVDSIRPHPDPLLKGEGTPLYRFKTNGSVLLFEGFLKVTPQALDDRKLPVFVQGEKLALESIRDEPHETTPPPRYNDASLIKTLEEKSIGRPSTYASIISTLSDRGYLERVERRFEPTSVGMAVNDFLVKNFSSIDDIPFTAQMEEELDSIAEGKLEWSTMMNDFYTPFAKEMEKAGKADRVKIEVETTDELCPECKQGNLVVRTGKFGKFLSCERFPECHFTKPFVEETNVLCPKDGGKVIIKKTRKGRKFFGCSNYPNCDFAAWKLEDIKKAAK